MKKIISIILIACMCISLCIGFTSCNTDTDDGKSTPTQDTNTENKSEEITTEEITTEEDTTEENTTKENVSEEIEEKSEYSVFYFDTGDDAIYLIEYNEDGLAAFIYYDEAFYGECDGERRLDYSIEYTDGLISKISGDDYYYEIKYNDDFTYGYGISYRSDVQKKTVTGDSLVICYGDNKNLASISVYDTEGDLLQYVFDENGRLAYFFDDEDVDKFCYDENGRFASCIHTRVNNDSFEKIFTFNYEGDSTLPYAYSQTVNGVMTIKCEDVSFTDQGKLINATLTYCDDEDEYICQNTNNFDESGRLVDYTLKQGYASEGLETYRTELKYNDRGLLWGKSEFEYDGDRMYLCAKTVYDYDENGNLIFEMRSSYTSNGTLVNYKVTNYTYDENGRLLSKLNENSDGMQYTYDADGLVIKEISTYNKGVSTNTINYEWIFDENGRLIKGGMNKFTYDENGRISSYTDILSNNGDEKIYEFSYDENGRIITVSTVRKSISIVKNQGEINYTYSEDGRITQESISRVDDKTGETFTTVYDYTNVK